MICGIDEAGRGPVLGPLVVAGVMVDSDAPLRALNVRDSKKLTPERRTQLAPQIEKVGRFEILVVSAKDIDISRGEMSLNDIEARLFARIIERMRPAIAYVDAVDVDEIDFKRSIQRYVAINVDHPADNVEIVSQHNADELFPVVSAASILAKVRRDAEIKAIETELGEPIGSGYPADPVTIAFLERWVYQKGSLPPHTRTTWDTAKRLMRNASMRKIEEFGGGKA